MDDLIAFLHACIDEDEQWAIEASREDGKLILGGVHWQWVEPETDTPVTPDPTRDDYLTDDADNFRFSLRSEEEFPTEYMGPLPQFAIHEADEIPSAVAGHIARHAPARVLREVEAKRRVMARHSRYPRWANDPLMRDACNGCGYEGPTEEPRFYVDECPELRDLASVYADRPGYQERWRP